MRELIQFLPAVVGMQHALRGSTHGRVPCPYLSRMVVNEVMGESEPGVPAIGLVITPFPSSREREPII